MTLVLAFFRLPLGRYFVIGFVVQMAVLGLRAHWIGQGVRQEKAAEARRVAAAQKNIVRHEAQAQVITDKAKTDLDRRRVEIRTVTQTLIKEVPIYVSAKADAECIVPAGFVRLHDQAAAGPEASLPSPAGGPLDAPSGVPLSAVAETVVANYGAAHDWRAEAMTWRAWYAAQKTAWEKP